MVSARAFLSDTVIAVSLTHAVQGPFKMLYETDGVILPLVSLSVFFEVSNLSL